MIRKTIALITISSYVIFSASPGFAGYGIVLTDYELDQVHAGGLNLSFDGFLGNIGTTLNNSSKGNVPESQSLTKGPLVLNKSNHGIEILQPKSPKEPIGPIVPSSPKTPISPTVPKGPNNPVVPTNPIQPILPNQPTTPSSVEAPFSPISPDVPDAPVGPASPDLPNIPNVPNVPTAPSSVDAPFAPISPVAPVAPVTPSFPDAPTAPATVELPSAPVSPTLPTLPDAPFQPLAPESPVAPVSPTAPVAPQLPVAPIVSDAYTSSNGKFGVVAFESLGNLKSVGLNSNDVNTLNVSETAQQYLSSINNVNAAGSTVLIQQNLVVLINSTVQNLNNANDLNLGNLIALP